MWQKDQLVTQLHWQENGPTFSSTPYRYQACRCEDPGGWLQEAQPRCGGRMGKDIGEAGEDHSLGGCYPRPDQGAGPGSLMAPHLAARFGQVPDQPAGLRLFTVQIPHKRLRQPPPCYLTAWDGSTFLPLRTKSCGHEVISCLSVRYEMVPVRLAVRVAGAAWEGVPPEPLRTVIGECVSLHRPPGQWAFYFLLQ